MKSKIYVLIIWLALTATAVFSQTVSLEVTVKNIKASKGTIRVGIYTNEKDFPDHAQLGKIVKASGTEVVVIFENLSPGEYAISVIHDENENGELDSNFMGIPKEGFGFGNNAMGSFGPPSFEKAKIQVEGNQKHEVKLRYM